MKKYLVWFLIVIFTVSIIFIGAGCKTTTTTAATAAAGETTSAEKKFEGVTIKALLIGGPEYEPWWAKITADFEQKTGIKVKYDMLIFEELMKKEIVLSAAKNSDYDVYSAHQAQIASFYSAYEPLDSYLAGDEQDFPAQQVPRRPDGKIVAIPKHTDARILFYLTDVFNAAGLKPPTTWDELIQVAEKLNKPPDQYGFVITGRGDPFLRQYTDLLWEWGGDILDKDMKPIFNSPEGIAALQFYSDIINKYKIVPPDSASYGWEEPSRLFAQGNIAMVQDWPGIFGMYDNPETSKIVGKYSIAPIPVGPKTNIANAGSHMMAINAYSKQKDAAWEFIKYIVSKEVLMENYKFNGQIPTRASALKEIADNATGMEKDKISALGEGIKNGKVWPVFPEWNEVSAIMWNEGQAALTLSKTPEQALSDAEAATIQVLQRAGYIK